VFLRREGLKVGKEACQRLWSEQGLQVPKKRPRRRIAGSRPRPLAPAQANSVWSYDFVYDACANGQKLKCLTVVDEYTREALAIDVAGSIRSSRVIEILAKLISVRGAPRYLRSDNGPEFVSTALLSWVVEQGIETALIDPGKPWQNGTNESFNGKFRRECLAMEWFRNRIEAMVVIEGWRQHYNTVRPHSSLNYATPEAFSRTGTKGLLSGAISS
jgi:putative transposase